MIIIYAKQKTAQTNKVIPSAFLLVISPSPSPMSIIHVMQGAVPTKILMNVSVCASTPIYESERK